MKKIILLLLLVLVSVTASARKSYIYVYAERELGSHMTGDIPKGIADFRYENVGTNRESARFDGTVGALFTILSEYGYEVEFMCTYTEYAYAAQYLLSKEIPSGSQTQIEGDVNHDSEVNIADVNRVISLILDKLRENPKLLEELGIVQPK